jgi:hypothetical protein
VTSRMQSCLMVINSVNDMILFYVPNCTDSWRKTAVGKLQIVLK